MRPQLQDAEPGRRGEDTRGSVDISSTLIVADREGWPLGEDACPAGNGDFGEDTEALAPAWLTSYTGFGGKREVVV